MLAPDACLIPLGPEWAWSELAECVIPGCPEGSLQVSSVSSPLRYRARAPSLASHVAAHGQCPGFCCEGGRGTLGERIRWGKPCGTVPTVTIHSADPWDCSQQQ